MNRQHADTAFLELSDVTVRFGERAALSGASLQIREAECFGLLGPNGSGKSTALRVLAGLLAPNEGECLWRGVGLDRARLSEYRSRLGVVFQSPSLDDILTCSENLRLADMARGLPRKGRVERVERALAEVGLSDRAKSPVSTLSGGFRRRLDLARALLHRPELLLMDEPSVGLDERAFRRMWELLGQLASDRGITIVVSTHRTEEAEHCDRVAFLNEGDVKRVATPSELRSLVSNDVVTLDVPDVQGATAVLEGEGYAPHWDGKSLVVEVESGPEFVAACAPLVHARAISVRRPSLADAFHLLSGAELSGPEPRRKEKLGLQETQ